MFTIRDLVVGIALPALVSAAMLLASAWFGRERVGIRAGLESSAIAIGFCAGFIGLFGLPPFPPIDSTNWLVYLAVLACVSALIDMSFADRMELRILNVGLVAVVTTALVLWPKVRYAWSATEATLVIAAISAALTLVGYAIDRQPAGTHDMLLADLACGAGLGAITILLSGSQKLGQIGGALAAPLVASLIAAHISKRIAVRGASTLCVVIFGGLVMSSHFYAKLTVLNTVLLCVAPLAGWIRHVPPIARLGLWPRRLMGTTAVALFAGSAAVLAAIEFARSVSEYEY